MQLGRTQRAHVYICREREPWEVGAYVTHLLAPWEVSELILSVHV